MGFAPLNPSYKTEDVPRTRPLPASARRPLHLVLLFLGRLGAGAAQALDAARRQAGLFRDLAVLLLDDHLRRRIPVEAAQHVRRYPAVRALGPVLISDVEKHVFADGAASGLAGHWGWSFLSL